MAEIISIHSDNPQLRLLRRVVDCVQRGGVIVFPTDSAYALGCALGEKQAAERIRRIRQLTKHHHFTLICRDLSELSQYARVDNPTFRLLKAHTPGPFTFILNATKEVPRRLQNPRSKTIGLRVPDHVITQALLQELQQALMSVTLILPGETEPMADVDEIQARLGREVDMIVDGGNCGIESTTVIDLTEWPPQVIRVGKGNLGTIG